MKAIAYSTKPATQPKTIDRGDGTPLNMISQKSNYKGFQVTEKVIHLGKWQFSAGVNSLTGCEKFRQLFDLDQRQSWGLLEVFYKISVEERGKFIAQVKQAMKIGMISTELSIVPDINNDRRWVRITGAIQFIEDGDDCRFVGYAEDVTIAKKIEIAKDDFPAFLNHQIRNPLTTIQLYMQMIEKKATINKDQDLLAWAGKANEQIQALEKLTTTYLDQTALSNGCLLLKRGHFQLHKYLKSYGESLRLLYPERLFKLEIEPFTSVYADQCKIEEVLQNLTSNALKYSFPGSAITIQCKKETSCYRVSVINYGTGIQADEKEQLFDKYFRTKHSVGGSAKGHGLGLHLVKRIIEQHAGQVGVNCLEGNQIEFFFTIPVTKL